MNVVFKHSAEDTLRDIAEFIDDMNVSGAGERWAERFVEYIYRIAKLENLKFPLCHNESLANAGFSCIIYKGWVIVFKIEKQNFVVYQIVLGSLIY
jgi:hypothetical protein